MKKNRMKRIIVLLALCAFSVNAQISDYERGKIESLLYNDAVKIDSAIFDGNTFNENISVDAGYSYMIGFINGINDAVHAINGMTAPARKSEAANRFISDVREKIAYSEAMRKAFPGFEKAKKMAVVEKHVKPSTTEKQIDAESKTTESANVQQDLVAVKQHLEELTRLVATGGFDGKAFDSSISLPDAQLFQQRFVKAANLTANAYNALPTDTQRTNTAQSLLEQVKLRLDQARRLTGALANHRAMLQRKLAEDTNKRQALEKQRRAAQARERAIQKALAEQQALARIEEVANRRAEVLPICEAFSSEVMTRRNTRAIRSFMENPDAIKSDYRAVSSFLARAADVAASCAKTEFADMLEVGCSDLPHEDPAAWCKVADNAAEDIRGYIVREQPNWEMIAEARYISADKLMQNDGWVPIEQPTTLAQVLSFDRMMYMNTPDFGPDRQRELFGTLGISEVDFPYREAAQTYIDEMAEAIGEGANDWPSVPRADSTHDTEYGPALAAEQLQRQWHTDVEFSDAWLGRSSWQIHRNELGVVLRRTLPGYVMYKLPNDRYCQLRSFTLTEQHTGGGSFQVAHGVRFGYVRFQDCGRP